VDPFRGGIVTAAGLFGVKAFLPRDTLACRDLVLRCRGGSARLRRALLRSGTLWFSSARRETASRALTEAVSSSAPA